MLIALLSLLCRLLLWISSSLLAYFTLTLSLVLTYNLYKTILARRWQLPVSGKDAILITGATSGIGLAVAKHLHSLGYSIIATYYNDKEPGYAELFKLSTATSSKKSDDKHQQVVLIGLDVRSEQSIKEAGEQCRVELRNRQLNLYAIINNAGLGSLQPFAWLQRKNIKALIETNLTGSMLVTREFLPLLIKSKGRILNVSSGLGLVPGETYVTYGTTKCALVYLTRALNYELSSSYGVKAVAIIPHNFIKNTNICAQNVKTNELAWEELGEEERKLYENEFKLHNKLARKLEQATKDMRTNDQLNNNSSQQRNRHHNQHEPDHFIGKMIAGIEECVASLKGESQAKSLEESGALQGFVDALRLPDPPELIFAGDLAYSLLVGSILLSLPNSCSNLLSSSVKPSLYR